MTSSTVVWTKNTALNSFVKSGILQKRFSLKKTRFFNPFFSAEVSLCQSPFPRLGRTYFFKKYSFHTFSMELSFEEMISSERVKTRYSFLRLGSM